ncbi:uncharacterized protein LOC124198011 [Daphnia pulex]|uniref:uncharacterized protein LOC124198011 n=1 Tax=Daphnia pulex TaxID=6669 RepID=UPI001EE03954|nr:uncharacterized protein LOC124198011 [Daphnia pulex]
MNFPVPSSLVRHQPSSINVCIASIQRKMSKDRSVIVILFLVVFGCFQLAFGQNREDQTAYLSTGSGGLGNNSQADGDRSSKFISLFSIVRFSNTPCTTSTGLNGTCFTSSECSKNGGTATGSCASGFGVCCVVTIQTCGQTTSLNSTYWQNPGYTNTYTTAGQCSLYVTKSSSDICQLRLDFIGFTLANPDTAAKLTAGQCLVDVFTVTGQSNTVPAICGSNANQHIYMDMTPGTQTFSLNMILTGTTTSRLWNIRISQIPCGTSYTAPENCLQYFTEPTGTITSFNYQYATTPLVQHLAYQDYNICIRTNQGFCGICYVACTTAVTNAEPAFAISGVDTNVAAAAFAAGTTSLVDTDCGNDWLQIPCATDQMNSVYTKASVASPTGPTLGCVNKLCGVFFSAVTAAAASAPVYSYTKPFNIYFHTDGSEYGMATADAITTTTESFGFCLSYTQQACSSTVSVTSG